MNQPNVVLCLCDMLRAFEVGCYGNSVIRTPHLDQLAQEGLRFDLAVTNNPLCTPARSCLISGQYSRTCTGATGNTNELWPNPRRRLFPDPTIAEVFRQAGYHTALIGKWHIEPDPLACGFEQAVYPNVIHRHYGQQYVDNHGPPFPVEEFAPDFELQRVDQFLARSDRRPFFLFHSISQPHMPLGPGNAPRRYLDLYRREQIPLRPNVFINGQIAHDREWFITYTDPDYWYRRWKGQPRRATDVVPDDFDLRELIRHYYGLTTSVDDQVGALMNSLRRHGLAENTLVVFLSDHGDNLGSHHRFNKGLLIEESIRVPLIFWFPGRLKPQDNTEQVARIIDVMPTLLDGCGLQVPRGVQGRSLLPAGRGRTPSLPDNYAFIETPSNQIGIRSPTHLYGIQLSEDGRGVADDRFQFFDLTQDPYQQNNLAKSDEQSELAEELRHRLLRWHDATPWLNLC